MAEPLKEMMNETTVLLLAKQVDYACEKQGNGTVFDGPSFTQTAMTGLAELELKARIIHIAKSLRIHLPQAVPVALQLLVAALPEPRKNDAPETAGFPYWPFLQFVEMYGVGDFEPSMRALYCMTQQFSAEFAIRPFLARYQAQTLQQLAIWVEDDCPKVRRLVSEGTRPRLPWGSRLKDFQRDPAPVFALLELLKDDPSEVVRRSVANNLNDISKDHPEGVVEVMARWLGPEGKLLNKEALRLRRRLVAHALRTLVKAGHSGALKALGFGPPQVDVCAFSVSPEKIELGQHIHLSATVLATHTGAPTESQGMVIDFVIHHVKANQKTSPKVFKWKTLQLNPGEQCQLSKKHGIKRISTRVYYSGTHKVDVQINGVVMASSFFELTLPE